jgi:hypothetical protein
VGPNVWKRVLLRNSPDMIHAYSWAPAILREFTQRAREQR